MKMHVTDAPTEAEVKALLAQMTMIFTGLEGGGVGIRVVWSDTLPDEILAEAKKRNASFIVKQSETEFLLGYKGDKFLGRETVYIPPPADRMTRYTFPGPKLCMQSLPQIALP